MSVLTGVHIKWLNFRENVWAFGWEQENCPQQQDVCNNGRVQLYIYVNLNGFLVWLLNQQYELHTNP